MGEFGKRWPRLIGRAFDVLAHLDQITIGAINGYAVCGGWSFALAFDFAIAVEGAEFWMPEVDLDVPYRGAPASVLAARLGPWRAKDAILMCRHYRAEELLAMGVLNRVVKRDALMPAAREAGENDGGEIARRSRGVQARYKCRVLRPPPVLNRIPASPRLPDRSVVATGARLHERNRHPIERLDNSRDLPALNRRLGLRRLQATRTHRCNRSCDVRAHQRKPPASRTPAPRSHDFEHGLLELEKRLSGAIAGFTDSLASDADRLVRRDRLLQHRGHHHDMLEILDAVRVAPA